MLTLKVKAKGIDSGDLGDVLGLVAEDLRKTPGASSRAGNGWSYKLAEGRPARDSYFAVKIETENEAFSGGNRGREVARILRKVAEAIEKHGGPLDVFDRDKLRDVNGNTVGKITVRKARKARKAKA